MRIAFLTPMKPPDHPVPSGDRAMARLLIEALRRAGHETLLPSRLRTWWARPDRDRLATLERAAAGEAARLVAAWREAGDGPDLVLTYHLYHKAPDLLGPRIARDLRIPYVVVEASRSARRARDDWRDHFLRAEDALALADAVVAVSAHDEAGLTGTVPADRLHRLPPFVDAAPFAAARAAAGPREDGPVRILTAAMMRPGRKTDSFRVLADALRRLVPGRALSLTLAGDGPERAAVEAMFRGLPARFVGCVDHAAIADLYAGHDLFAWPAVEEPWGIVFLEAQAAGLPVVGSDARGVPGLVLEGTTGLLAPSGDAAAFADALAGLLDDPGRLSAMGAAAAAHVRRSHDIDAAARWLDRLVSDVLTGPPARVAVR